MVLANCNCFIIPNVFALVFSNLQGFIFADLLVFIIFDYDCPVLLAMKIYLLRILGILKSELVRSSTTFGAVGLHRALCLFSRKCIWGHVVPVIDPACNNRLIRVSFKEFNK